MKEPVRILVVDDQKNDYELAKREINHVLKSCEYQCVDNRDDFLSALKKFKPDLVVTDYSMPNFDGLAVLDLTIKFDRLIPVIIFTGSIDEETAAETVKSGAVDYVLKERISDCGKQFFTLLKKSKCGRNKLRPKKNSVQAKSDTVLFQR